MACAFLRFREVETGTKSKTANLTGPYRMLDTLFLHHIKYTPPKTVDSPDSQLPKKVD